MKLNKWLIPFGMIGVLSFLLLDVFGKILWPEYNPITTYVSKLVTDEAPHVHLMRFFLNTYTVCFLLFSLGMTILSFSKYHIYVKLGYTVMFASALISVIGYGGYPISMVLIFSKNDIIHVVVTVTILCATALSILLITIGYLKQEKLKILGLITLVAFLFFVVFNLWHLYAILNGYHILGFIERIIFYTVHALTVILSWVYTFRKNRLIEEAAR
ncbi:DUF998 domain-containing protein [Lachnoclostridium phytofermentans]|uniref:DUF998 domain-containing protein n=1 Tax=Lachnoclostridium phytofermentans (strain ATCC 700394 / DSM 18823 / ISDg) TaxID=357809 RepID=A9KKH9_LACP7|nr:DUF998 domain-containing protein [Lachnoclostridium phytofermentans]ABX41150.1 hypothetical protein Cphy_0763 [Lachnoclostridium phytofermentans ISDg]